MSDATQASDPFRALGVTPSFDLKLADLERRQRELSKALHPDRHAGSPAGERRAALNEAIRVNEAFRTLRDPITRAEALLQLLQGPHPAEAAETKMSGAFLMQVMDTREQLSEARHLRDLARLEALQTQIGATERALCEALRGHFDRALAGAPIPPELHSELAQLRYARRMLDEVRVSLDELG